MLHSRDYLPTGLGVKELPYSAIFKMASSIGHQLPPIEKLSFKFALRSNGDKSIFNFANVNGGDQELFSDSRWKIEDLEFYRNQLNECKAQVGTFPLHEWEKHTETTEVSSNIRKVLFQRLANRPPILTRAWIKFYDIMGTFPLFSSTDDCTIRSLFLCEGICKT